MSVILTPDWVKHAIFYQIFPDRFAKSDKQQLPVESWDSPATPSGYKGGDLWGAIEQLDHIQALGANALYLCPIFMSTTNHRYNTHDYKRVDPMLGGNEAAEKLIEEAHRRNIRVVFDGVFNHVAPTFLPFADIMENQQDSPYRDWFIIEKYPVNAYDHSKPATYWAWWNLHHMPKLNHANPQVQEYIYSVAEYWLKKGIDGWRLDVPSEIKVKGFWEGFRQRVKQVNPDAYIVGEIWSEAKHWLKGDQFDAVMNYQWTDATLNYVAGDRFDTSLVENRPFDVAPTSGADYAKRLEEILDWYHWEVTTCQMNLLDSHDMPRLITLARNDRTAVKLGALLLLTYPGAPSIYYGDEIGMTGGAPEEKCREPMPWQQEVWDTELMVYYQSLTKLRNQHPALRTGSMTMVYSDDHVLAYRRTLAQDDLLVLTNNADSPKSISQENLPDAELSVLWGEIDLVENDWRLPARSGAVLKVSR